MRAGDGLMELIAALGSGEEVLVGSQHQGWRVYRLWRLEGSESLDLSSDGVGFQRVGMGLQGLDAGLQVARLVEELLEGKRLRPSRAASGLCFNRPAQLSTTARVRP